MDRLRAILAFTIVILVAGLFVAGCGTGESMAQYRLVQTIPDAPSALAVSMNGKSAFTNLAFGTVAPVSAHQSIAAQHFTGSVSDRNNYAGHREYDAESYSDIAIDGFADRAVCGPDGDRDPGLNDLN
jgi:hypothetical protein